MAGGFSLAVRAGLGRRNLGDPRISPGSGRRFWSSITPRRVTRLWRAGSTGSSAQALDTKFRILLLEREAPEGFGWWRELTGSGLNTARERRDLFYTDRPRQLPDLSDLEERRDLMAAALQGARELRSTPSGGPEIPPKDADPDFDRALGRASVRQSFGVGDGRRDRARSGGPSSIGFAPSAGGATDSAGRELDRFAALAQSRRVSGDGYAPYRRLQ